MSRLILTLYGKKKNYALKHKLYTISKQWQLIYTIHLTFFVTLEQQMLQIDENAK